jgi:hypothetical protein
MELHKGRQTEAFYEKMLACYLYERGIPYMTQVDSPILERSWDIKDIPPPLCVTMSMKVRQRAWLGHLEDVMEVTGPEGLPRMTREMTVTFENAKGEWKGVFEANLIFDDSNIHQMTMNGDSKSGIAVQKVMGHGAALIMTVRIKNLICIMKCNVKALASRYQSFYSKDRMITVIEREAEGYKYALSKPDLKERVIPMYAHGQLIKFAPDGSEVEKEWEVIILKHGSSKDLFHYASDVSGPTAEQQIKMLTKESCKMLRTLNRNGMTHGDAKCDQLIWKSERDIGTEKLCWLDFGRCVIDGTLDKATVNLRRLGDIFLMLAVSAYALHKQKYLFHYSNINMDYVRRNITLGSEWPPDFKNYLIPNAAIGSIGGLINVDRFCTNFVCKRYYGGNYSLLESLDTDKFLGFLLEGDHIFELITAIWALAGKAGQAKHDFYADELIMSHPSYQGPRLPPPTQGPPLPQGPPPPQAIPMTITVLTFQGNVLYSQRGLPYHYTLMGGQVQLYEGQAPTPMQILPCLGLVHGQILHMNCPYPPQLPMFFGLRAPGVMDLLVDYGQGLVRVLEQRL